MPRPVRITGTKGRRAIPSLVRTSGVAPSSFLTTRLPKFSVKLEGANKARKIFDKLLKNSESSLRKAVSASCGIIAYEARRIVMIGPYKAYRTGNMARNIRWMVEEFTLDYIYGVAGVFDVDYAIYVHEGTYKMAAKPFLLLALKRKKKLIIKLLNEALAKDIAKGII